MHWHSSRSNELRHVSVPQFPTEQNTFLTETCFTLFKRDDYSFYYESYVSQ